MNILLERADPRVHMDELVALYEQMEDRRDIKQILDWYYRDYGGETPTSWNLRSRSNGGLIGLCSVNHRTLRWNETRLKVGFLGNYLVDSQKRIYLGAISLLRAVQSLVSTNQVDILLGAPNQNSLRVVEGLGFKRLGAKQWQTQVFRSRSRLRARFGLPGVALGPFVDLWGACRRLPITRNVKDFKVVELNDRNLRGLGIESWTPPEGCFVHEPTAAFLRWRFLECPRMPYRVLGLTDPHRNEIVGYAVVASDSGETNIWDCRTDTRRLSEADAIINVCRHGRLEGGIFHVGLLRDSQAAGQLRALGFGLRRGGTKAVPEFAFVGYWKPDHPMAAEFAQPENWNLFAGFGDT